MGKKRLIIDLEKCYRCKKCVARCSYQHGEANKGINQCLMIAARELVCRRCEESPCVRACPQKALEKDAEGKLEWYPLRCTSCKTCTMACPFGVLYPDLVNYKTSLCDLCADRVGDNEVPVCVASCPHGALRWEEAEEDPEKDLYAVCGGRYLVHTVKWKKDLPKK
jgi:Fe-S-cluster-containing dehydrogenase component